MYSHYGVWGLVDFWLRFRLWSGTVVDNVFENSTSTSSFSQFDGDIVPTSKLDPIDRKAVAVALAFVGELDFTLVPEVRAALGTINIPAQIDLSLVRYVDARIIGEFVRLAKRIAPERIQLFGVQSHVRRVITMVKLDQIFALCDEPYRGSCRTWKSPLE